MRILITNTPEELDCQAAEMIAEAVRSRKNAVVGLSTGRTTGGIHRAFVRLVQETGLDCSGVTFFGQDEVAGIPRTCACACYTMLMNELIGPLGIPEDRFLMLPTESDDFDRDCRAFIGELDRRGGVDFLFLGLGENGPLGFNQPGTPLGSGAHLSTMDPDLEARIRRETGTPADKPLGGVTMGLRDVMHARKLVLAAKGTSKSAISQKMIEGPVTEDVPASVLQLHPDCTILLDREAASQITL
jgi:glucosamine-6-phosphate deaminase